jgi:hypothetical protein
VATSGEPVAALGGGPGARGSSASRSPPQRSITAAEPTLSSSQVTSTRSTRARARRPGSAAASRWHTHAAGARPARRTRCGLPRPPASR